MATAHKQPEARCWCKTCRPITMDDMRFVVCHNCGDKRCVHATYHEAPCAKTDIYAHNSFVERRHIRQHAAIKELREALRKIAEQHGQWNNGMWAAGIARAAIANKEDA